MPTSTTTVRSTMKQPSAFLPVVLSLAALTMVVGHIAIYGAAREGDEGVAAHLFQLLIAAQVPLVAFFAITGLPRASRETLYVLLVQAGAVLAAMAPVFVFHL